MKFAVALLLGHVGIAHASGVLPEVADYVDIPTNRTVVGVEFGAPCKYVGPVRVRKDHPMYGVLKDRSVFPTRLSRRLESTIFFGIEYKGPDAEDSVHADIEKVLGWLERDFGLVLEKRDKRGKTYWSKRIMYDTVTAMANVELTLDIVRGSQLRLTVNDRDWGAVGHIEEIIDDLKGPEPDDYCEEHSLPSSLVSRSSRPNHIEEWAIINAERGITSNSCVKLTKKHLRDYMELLRDLNDFHRNGLRMSHEERKAIDDGMIMSEQLRKRQEELNTSLFKRFDRWDDVVMSALPEGSKSRDAYAKQVEIHKKLVKEDVDWIEGDLSAVLRANVVSHNAMKIGTAGLAGDEAREYSEFVRLCEELAAIGREMASVAKPKREYVARKKALAESLCKRIETFSRIIKGDELLELSPRYVPPLETEREKDVGLGNILGLAFPKMSLERQIVLTNVSEFSRIELDYSEQRLEQVFLVREFSSEVTIDDVRKHGEALKKKVEGELGVSFVEANAHWQPSGFNSNECTYSSFLARNRYHYRMCIVKNPKKDGAGLTLLVSVDDENCRRLARKAQAHYPELTDVRFGGFQLGEKYNGDFSRLGKGVRENTSASTNFVPFCCFDSCVAEIDNASTNIFEVEYYKRVFPKKETETFEDDAERICDQLEKDFNVVFSRRDENGVDEKLGRFRFEVRYGKAES